MGIPEAIGYVLNKIPAEAVETFWKAAHDWEQLTPKERELLQQEDHSFKEYLRLHSIDHTRPFAENTEADWESTPRAQSLRAQKQSYITLTNELTKSLENLKNNRNFAKFSDTLDKLAEAKQQIEAILIAEDADRYHFNNNKTTVALIPELKERYQGTFLRVSHEARLRGEAGTTFPVYYARPTEGKLTRIFYIHPGGTELDLQKITTDTLVKLSRTNKIQHIGNFVLVQSNIARPPTEIEQDKILKSLGLQPEVITV